MQGPCRKLCHLVRFAEARVQVQIPIQLRVQPAGDNSDVLHLKAFQQLSVWEVLKHQVALHGSCFKIGLQNSVNLRYLVAVKRRLIKPNCKSCGTSWRKAAPHSPVVFSHEAS